MSQFEPVKVQTDNKTYYACPAVSDVSPANATPAKGDPEPPSHATL